VTTIALARLWAYAAFLQVHYGLTIDPWTLLAVYR
jgi:hypothetical protein